jgi:hypothetical protein
MRGGYYAYPQLHDSVPHILDPPSFRWMQQSQGRIHRLRKLTWMLEQGLAVPIHRGVLGVRIAEAAY